MILYNVVIEVDRGIRNDFIEWYRKKHIPELIATGLFIGFNFSKQIELPNSEKSVYVFRFYFQNTTDYRQYIDEFSTATRNNFPKIFEKKYKSYRTIEEF